MTPGIVWTKKISSSANNPTFDSARHSETVRHVQHAFGSPHRKLDFIKPFMPQKCWGPPTAIHQQSSRRLLLVDCSGVCSFLRARSFDYLYVAIPRSSRSPRRCILTIRDGDCDINFEWRILQWSSTYSDGSGPRRGHETPYVSTTDASSFVTRRRIRIGVFVTTIQSAPLSSAPSGAQQTRRRAPSTSKELTLLAPAGADPRFSRSAYDYRSLFADPAAISATGQGPLLPRGKPTSASCF